MAYRSDESVALALLESAILTCGIAHIALLNDLYLYSPVAPASIDAAAARLSSRDFGSFLIAMPFAFFAAWPLAALGTGLTRFVSGKARSLALPLVLMPFGVAGLALAVQIFGLILTDAVTLIMNGAAFGFLCGLLARVLMVFQSE